MRFYFIFFTLFIYVQSDDYSNKFKDVFASITQFFESIGRKIKNGFKSKKPAITAIKNKIGNSLTTQGQNFYRKALKGFVTNSLNIEEPDYEYKEMCKKRGALLRTEQLIKKVGRRVEIHRVQTEDGYVLQLHRIVVSKKVLNRNKTVLLHHGLLGSSADWLLLGSHKALPYLLSDAGYDVWLLNARGNYYSRTHTQLFITSVSYWNFTFAEIGKYDLRAVIDYVQIRKKNDAKLYFIAHSIGVSSLLVLLTSFPRYNKYFEMGILLGPLAFMSETNGPLRLLASIISCKDVNDILVGMGEFYPKRIPIGIANQYCDGPLVFCRNPLFFIAGCLKSTPFDDKRFLTQIMCQVPAGTSMQAVLHLAQLVQTGHFHPYNQPHKEYPLQRVSVPIAIFSSTDDMISTVHDATKLFVNINSPIEHIVLKNKNISHTEFVWGYEASELVYKKILFLFESKAQKSKDNDVVGQGEEP